MDFHMAPGSVMDLGYPTWCLVAAGPIDINMVSDSSIDHGHPIGLWWYLNLASSCRRTIEPNMPGHLHDF